jgi:hypothetical protein
MNERRAIECAKKLMITCNLRSTDSVKMHIEKAYEIGFNDARRQYDEERRDHQIEDEEDSQ